MGVKIREKIKGSGVWWVFISYHGQRRSLMVGEKNDAIIVGSKVKRALFAGEFYGPEEALSRMDYVAFLEVKNIYRALYFLQQTIRHETKKRKKRNDYYKNKYPGLKRFFKLSE